MTVSRVINRDGRVLPATRVKVEQAIGALGYIPNAAARRLAGAQQCRIVLLYSNPSAAYLSEFLLGSLGAARESDAEMIVEQQDPGERAGTLAARMAAHRVDGVLLPPPLCDDPLLLEALRTTGLAVAQVATGRPASFADAVFIDDEAAAFAMTTHLIALGHRRIGFIAGNPNQIASERRRCGYARALRSAGLQLEDALVAEGDFTYLSGLAAAEMLLRGADRPSAIFASNDDMAAAVIGRAHRQGLDVPKDLTVCGFDDTAIARTISPELTTIRQPVSTMAWRATHILIQTIGEKRGADAKVRHVQLDFELMVRESDAPFAAGT
jgi:LacI family transcriptional regulator